MPPALYSLSLLLEKKSSSKMEDETLDDYSFLWFCYPAKVFLLSTVNCLPPIFSLLYLVTFSSFTFCVASLLGCVLSLRSPVTKVSSDAT